MNFENKVVLVTGASSGIGAAIAVAFAKEGADVVLVGRNETKLAAVEQTCASNGKPPLVVRADVSKNGDVNRIIQTTIDKYGKLDILLNNAGTFRLGNITDGNLIQAYDEIVATNLRAPMHLTALASPHLIATKGNIVNISSAAGQHTCNLPGIIPYSLTKAALNNFTLGSALELAAYGVRVNAVSPGPVYTGIVENTEYSNDWDVYKPLTALHRISKPEEVANLVLYVASDKAKAITGANYLCDNGLSLKVQKC